MTLENYGGRRFLLTVATGIATFVLVWLGKISGEVYATITIGTVAAYITGNVAQKIKQIGTADK